MFVCIYIYLIILFFLCVCVCVCVRIFSIFFTNQNINGFYFAEMLLCTPINC